MQSNPLPTNNRITHCPQSFGIRINPTIKTAAAGNNALHKYCLRVFISGWPLGIRAVEFKKPE